uniref:hypothetical protein n=1 Tax=Nocardioides lijunqiniae TaxID=2760832 RepID=UPI001D0BF4EF
GAWAGVVDALHLAGLAPDPHETADVVARRADDRLGVDAALTIAASAQRDAFGPDPAGASHFRAELRQVQRAARRTVAWWRRWWWHLDPRVLGR